MRHDDLSVGLETTQASVIVRRSAQKSSTMRGSQARLPLDSGKTRLNDVNTYKYVSVSGRNPARVVVHKSSMFSEDERAGFNKAIYGNEIPEKNFVTIRPSYSWINFIRLGNYPVLRGTMIEITNNEFLLYSSGYSPRIRSYAGHKIPNALRITHIGDSQNEEIAKEILGLTKLNWNTTAFSTAIPITLKFADGVGKILSELSDDEVLQDHYRFFM